MGKDVSPPVVQIYKRQPAIFFIFTLIFPLLAPFKNIFPALCKFFLDCFWIMGARGAPIIQNQPKKSRELYKNSAKMCAKMCEKCIKNV